MKPIAAVVVAVALFLGCLSSLVFAETISLGDYNQPGDFSLIHEDGEILAPVLLSLGHAGYTYIAQGKTVVIRTPAGKEIVLPRNEKNATVDGETLELNAAPRMVEQRLYIPLRSLAKPLGIVVNYAKEKKVLTLLPRLETVKVESCDEKVSVLLGAQVPLQYSLGKLIDPPRAFLDLDNVVLVEKAQKIEANAGTLLAVRAAARSNDNPGIRVVMDLTGPVEPQIKFEQDGCLLRLEFPKKVAVPPAAPTIVLQDITFQRTSAQLATVSLDLSAPTTINSEVKKDGKRIVVKIFSASKLEEAPKVTNDALVEGLEIRSLGDGTVQELEIKLKEKAGHLLTQEGKIARIQIGNFSLEGLKIVVDPGHGGCMSGAIGRSGLMEKEANLAIGLKLEELLKNAGAKVYMTRQEDCELRPIPRGDQYAKRAELKMRPALANSVKADLFVSIHCNANGDNGDRTGTEIYYWTPYSKTLAQTIREELVKALGLNDGGIFGNREFVVIKYGYMPSVLVEVAYISNRDEEALLMTEEFQTLAAKGIFSGITRYIKSGGVLGRQEALPIIPVKSEKKTKVKTAPTAQ